MMEILEMPRDEIYTLAYYSTHIQSHFQAASNDLVQSPHYYSIDRPYDDDDAATVVVVFVAHDGERKSVHIFFCSHRHF